MVFLLLSGLAAASEWPARRSTWICWEEFFKNLVQTGKVNKPSISSSFQDTGALNFSLGEDQPLTGERNSDYEETPGKKSEKQTQTGESEKESIFTKISVHEVPKMTYETSL